MRAVSWRTIGDVASEVGVSPQTLRVWEKQGLLVPDRTGGGQRRYDPIHVERARQIADLRHKHGWNPAAIRTSLEEPLTSQPTEEHNDGERLRRARIARGFSLEELAALSATSVAHLSSIERGLDRASTQLVARLTDALGVPMSGLADFKRTDATLVRRDERATVVLAGGVKWEELVLPGHDLEPALLTVPPQGSSGGAYSRSGETFVFVMSGTLRFRIGGGLTDHDDVARELHVEDGDSISVPSRTNFSWANSGDLPAQALWIELLSPQSWTDPTTRRIIRAASGFSQLAEG
jgi:DNA-binding transcriptional MerR regulator